MKKMLFVGFAILLTLNKLQAQITVTATGGTTGPTPYTTLKGAFDAINAGTHTNAITIMVTGNTTETASAALNATGSGSASYTSVVIKPDVATTPTISGSIASAALINLNGATNVVIDGSNTVNGSSKDLTISNTNTGTTSSTIRFINGASTNTIKNCIVKGVSTGSANGVVLFSTTTAATGNNNNTLQNNDLTKGTSNPAIIIYNAGTTAKENTGNLFIQNRFSDFSSSAYYDNGNSSGTSITSNEFFFSAAISTTSLNVIFPRTTTIKNLSVIGNYMHDLNSSTTTTSGQATITCINIFDVAPNSPFTIANNIMNLSGAASSTATIYGIWDQGDVNEIVNIYYNTIVLSGTTTGVNNASYGSASYCYYRNYADNTTLKNNILVNTRVPSGTYGYYQMILRNVATSGTFVSDYNDLYNSGASSANVLGGTATVYATLAAWQTATSMDANSKNVMPVFTSATNLHLVPNSNILLNAAATPIAGITSDYDGDIRDVVTPDMGADEFVPPMDDAGATAVANFCSGSQPVAVTIKNYGAATLNTVTVNWSINGIAQSPLAASALNLAPGATTTITVGNYVFTAGVSYIIVAATSLPNGNVDAFPSNDSYTLTAGAGLNGNYNVGAGGDYTSLTAAVTAYNANGACGPVTFRLTDASYSAGEIFPIVINQVPGSSAVNTLKIVPVTTASVSGNSATAIIKLNGADYVTIDGSNNGSASRNLTISNTNTAGSSVVLWIGSASTSNGANGNMVKNCLINGSGSSTTLIAIVSGSGSTIGAGGEAPNINNQYINNVISAAQYGIAAVGATGNESGTVISQNQIGSIAAASKMGFRALFLTQQSDAVVTQNVIAGVSINSTNASAGIYLGGTFSGGLLARNSISDVKNAAAYGAYGIQLAISSVATGLIIQNNTLYDIAGTGSATAANNGHGIYLTSGGGYKIYNNTVALTTSQTSTSGITSPICVSSGITTAASLDIRNNIFSNKQTVGNRYAVYCLATNAVYLNSDYNNYFTAGTNLGYLANDKPDMGSWRTATGKDLSSVTGDIPFISATDLHIDNTSINAWNVNGRGVAIAGIATDADGNTRSTTLGKPTDIGAYEFSTATTPADAVASAAPAVSTTTTYTSAGRKIAEITWGAGGTPPSSISFKYYPGNAPGNGTNAASTINSNMEIQAPDGSGYTYDIKLYYTDAEANALPDGNMVLIKKTGSAPYQAYASTIGSDAAGKHVISTGFNSFSIFSLANSAVPLDVHLLSFQGETKGSVNILYWKAENEAEGDSYELTRSTDGKTFYPVGTVRGAKQYSYEFTDTKPEAGINYYMLKMKQADGANRFSNVVALARQNSKDFAVQVYPNPAHEGVYVKTIGNAGAEAQISVTDVSGKVIRTVSNTGDATYVDLSGVAAGTYFIRYHDQLHSEVIKFTKQ